MVMMTVNTGSDQGDKSADYIRHLRSRESSIVLWENYSALPVLQSGSKGTQYSGRGQSYTCIQYPHAPGADCLSVCVTISI